MEPPALADPLRFLALPRHVEIERLATRLSVNKKPEALSLEGADGFFCARIASTTMIGPSAYLPTILGWRRRKH